MRKVEKREEMAKNREKDDTEKGFNSSVMAGVDSSISLLKLISTLIVFVVGVVIGLVSSSHINRYLTIQDDRFTFSHSYIDSMQFSVETPQIETQCEREDCHIIESFIRPRNLNHGMTDGELFWRASMVPQKEEFPFKKVPRVAFMFLTRGPLPMLPLWERFFKGQDGDKYSIYLHTHPRFDLNVTEDSVFYNRHIPSQGVEWGSVSLVDAEKRLLANALLDFSNERFILLSESCIPVYNFPIIYSYLIESTHSFVESYDDPSRYGRGRYSRSMRPDIKLADWRKGSQWFELHRTLAIKIVSDTKYYRIFEKYCTPSCYPDEHYIPTFLHIFHGSLNANRTITYVDWSQIAPHPASFSAVNITESFIRSIRNNGTLCSYNFEKTHICYLFARKFDASALEPLLNLTSKIMGF